MVVRSIYQRRGVCVPVCWTHGVSRWGGMTGATHVVCGGPPAVLLENGLGDRTIVQVTLCRQTRLGNEIAPPCRANAADRLSGVDISQVFHNIASHRGLKHRGHGYCCRCGDERVPSISQDIDLNG